MHRSAAAARPSRPRSFSRPAPGRAGRARQALVESFESRVLFHLAVQAPISDFTVGTNSLPTVLNVSQNIFVEEGPTVRLNYGTLGNIDIQLLQTQAPKSVANFLGYVNSGKFNNTVIHRSEPGFVVQGGGFTPSGTDITGPGTPTVENEFSADRSNVRGTVAYAKLGGDPNSATSEFFYNLANNSGNLDNQNGGFTVFARVQGNGMAVADAIAALQRVNATPINGAFNHLPVTRTTNPTLTPVDASGNGPEQTPQQDQMVILQSAAVLPVTFTATSSNTGLVNTTLNGSELTLNYTPGQVGTATITVRGTDQATNQTATDTFVVTVGAIEAGAGRDFVAQSIQFTDAEGTVSTLTVRGGSATLQFSGSNITKTQSGRTVVVNGRFLDVAGLVLAGDNPDVTFKSVGGDGKVFFQSISASGPVRGLVGASIVLRGPASFANGVGKFVVGKTENSTISINRQAGAPVHVSTVSITDAFNTTINSQQPLGVVATNTWTGGGVTAPSVRSILARRGSISGATIRATSSVGSVVADALSGTTIFAGVDAAAPAQALPSDRSSFTAPGVIRSVRVGSAFGNSFIAAATLGRLSLGGVRFDNAGTTFGVAGDTVQSVLATAAGDPPAGDPVLAAGLTEPGQSITRSDFVVRVL